MGFNQENIPPASKEVDIVYKMILQLRTWIDKGETDLIRNHWQLLSDKCQEYANDVEHETK